MVYFDEEEDIDLGEEDVDLEDEFLEEEEIEE